MVLRASPWASAVIVEEGTLLKREHHFSQLFPRDETHHEFAVETNSKARLLYVTVALLCMLCLAFMMGFRTQSFSRHNLKFSQVLVYIQTILGLCFVLSSSIIVVGLGFTTKAQCHAAIIVCLLFYTGAKISLYIFLLERAHIVRAPFMRRRIQDRIWVVGMVLIVLAFGALSIWSYLTPHAEISSVDGRCRIGLSPITSYLLLPLDAFINAGLTILFAILLRPVLRFRNQNSVANQTGVEAAAPSKLQKTISRIVWFDTKQVDAENVGVWVNIRPVLWKNVIGSALIFFASAANLTAFYVDESSQLGFLCLVACMADVTWGVLVVHWLTIGSTSENRRLSGVRPSQQLSTSLTSTATAVVKPEPAMKA